jgi:hypothetical protein
LLKKSMTCFATQLTGDDDLARAIRAVHLDHILGEINADGTNLHVDDPLRCSTITPWHIRCRERASSTTSFASVWPGHGDFRGRDASYLAPPAQIRTGPIRAYGSHLGCLTAKRLAGHG